jgi:hypothetical protein
LLVRLVTNIKNLPLLRQSKSNKGIWDGVTFTFDPIKKFDYLLILNFVSEDVVVTCPPENVWAIIQEPYLPQYFGWVKEGHSHFAKVFTPKIVNKTSKYIESHPALNWHVNKSYDELASMNSPPIKTKEVSWITSNKGDFPGHRKRMSFLSQISDYSPMNIDIYGKGIKYIEDKWEALAPYKYSLAIENSSIANYWTEKIMDCYLSYTLPFYYGAANLEQYFPNDSFIRIDINDPVGASNIMAAAIKNNEWERRLPSIIAAREKVLNNYQLFPYIANIIKSHNQNEKAQLLKIPAYKQSFKNKVYSKVARKIFKM